jgi:hypothetical protein
MVHHQHCITDMRPGVAIRQQCRTESSGGPTIGAKIPGRVRTRVTSPADEVVCTSTVIFQLHFAHIVINCKKVQLT